MKYALIRTLIFCLSIFSVVFAGPVLGQSNISYWVHKPALPVEVQDAYVRDFALTTDLAGNADYALVVGISDRTDRQDSPFVYDHFGFIDPAMPQKFWDMAELVGTNPVPGYPSYDQGVFTGVNSNGLVCGWFLSTSLSGESKIPVYLDLTEPVLQLELIPLPLDYSEYANVRADRVSDAGDILVILQRVAGGPSEPYIFDTTNDVAIEVPLQLDLSDGMPSFNSFRQIVGTRDDGLVVRHTVGASTEIFPDLSLPREINDHGQFVASLEVNKGRNKGDYAVRIGADGTEERRWEPPSYPVFYPQVEGINESGDALDQYENYVDGYYYHEGDPTLDGDEIFHVSLLDLVIPESDPDGSFLSSGFGENAKLSDRDNTGCGWIAADSYSGQNPDGSSRLELFLLIPAVLGQTPGISISPTSGLTTTESGAGQDNFAVVLDFEPAADVTIGISSSDTSEGTVDVSTLTFTPTNWDVAQTVTVTGVDDLDIDGDVAYTIITAAATSTDPNYDGLDAGDVSVTNLDDELPPSTIYDSTDTPLPIPDNDPNGIASNILVGDHTITNLTVNIDITHQRPSDLEVYLVGPDGGLPVQLFNFSGDNKVADFNGESSLGLWTLEVYDTRRKRTGTLNSWSITVDY